MCAPRLAARRGVVFLMALGAMAVLVIVAATANIATTFGQHQAGQTLRLARADALFSSALDAAVKVKTPPEGLQSLFDITEELTGLRYRVLGAWRPQALDSAIYRYEGGGRQGLNHRPGDVIIALDVKLILIKSQTPISLPQSQRLFLWNTNDQRPRPLALNRNLTR